MVADDRVSGTDAERRDDISRAGNSGPVGDASDAAYNNVIPSVSDDRQVFLSLIAKPGGEIRHLARN